MRILVATDAWRPQVNGVVNTYENLARQAASEGFEIEFLEPSGFRTVPCPTYPEIRLALIGASDVARRLERSRPDFVHVATEGPIGLATLRHCRRVGRPFTTSYHTRFPEYLTARFPVPLAFGYGLERWFHGHGAGVMVASPSLAADLAARGFRRIYPWSRGVDTDLFRPRPTRRFGNEQPVLLYVGRLAVEKNISAFLGLDVPGRKVAVGGGPMLESLARAHPEVLFTGPKLGEELAECYASADVLVFPSLTDTFGNVMLEALACGLPVAAFPVTGPRDLLTDPRVGAMDESLSEAVRRALTLSRQAAREAALSYSWHRCLAQFLDNIRAANAAATGSVATAASDSAHPA